MAVIVSDSLIPSRDNTPLDKRSKIASKSELYTIEKPNEGLLIYIEDEKTTYQVTNLRWNDNEYKYYITEQDIAPLGGGADVYFSEDGIAPENINTIWVDGKDNQPIDESTFDRIRTELNKLNNRISNIEYAFDVKLDSGDTTYYKGSELATVPGISPETQFELVLTFTYDGNEFTFEKNTYDGKDIRTFATSFELKFKNATVEKFNWTNSRVFFNTAHTKCSVTAMNHTKFDEFVLYNNETIIYKATLSSSELSSDKPTWAEKLQPNVHHICIKRAKTDSALNSYKAQDGELIYSMSTNKLYIGNDGRLATIGGGTGGNENVTTNYIDLYGPDGTTIYRITIDENGQVVAKLKSYYDNPEQKPGVAGSTNLTPLKISMVYAGPANATANSSNKCSHSFVELYNAGISAISLNGVSLCIGDTEWRRVIPLTGSIPAGCCYLVRFNPVSDRSNSNTEIIIDNYDLDAFALNPENKLSSAGFKIYLQIGTSAPRENVWDSSTTKGKVNAATVGYIDLVGAVSRTTSNGANEAELGTGKSVPQLLGDQMGIYRQMFADLNSTVPTETAYAGTGDTNDTIKDFRSFSYETNVNTTLSGIEMWDIKDFKPWCTKDGKKTMYQFKNKFKSGKPNMPTMSIGEVPSTRRFNWISTKDQTEKLYYRMAGQESWGNGIESNHESAAGYPNLSISNSDDNVYFKVHKASITGLAAGRYEWCVGNIDSNYISDVYTFTITPESLKNDGKFTFCQVSDQQGWTFGEYEPWNLAMKEIINKFNGESVNFPYMFDTQTNEVKGIEFLLNTGDMTQNGLRPAEWIDYYNCGQHLANVAQMNCVGNNDLCPGVTEEGTPHNKVNPTTFVYFYNYEYSNNENEKALQKYDGEFMKSVYAFDYGCAHFVCLNSNNYIDAQKLWFTEHMKNVNARENKPKWVLVYVHDAPFNIMTKSPSNTDNAKFYVGLETENPGAGLRDTKMNQKDHKDKSKRFSWSRLFEEYGVDVVLSGHKHTYSRTNPLIENTIDERLNDPTINKNGYEVNPWEPLMNTTVDSDGYTVTQVNVGEETKKGVIYVMCQATGFKLQSNKDIPAPNIAWLRDQNGDNYFPGSINGDTISVNNAQKAPTFIIWDVTNNTLTMRAYQVKNLTTGAHWDSFGKGDTTTKPNEIFVDPNTPIDTFKLIK